MVDGFSLHAGIAAKARERKKLKRLCRYITRPPVAEKHLSLTRNGMLLTESGINGSTERIFKGFTRFLDYLILLDFGE